MKNSILWIAGLSLIMAACGGGSASEEEQVKKEKDELAAHIDSLSNVLFSQETNINREVAADLLQSYIRFTDTYPADDRCADYLYKGAGIARGVGVHHRAMEMYQKILDDYPDFPKQAETHFLIAFTYDNDLKDIEAARIAYQEVIDIYPQHEFARQAEERLKTIDLTDEELIELFMQRNAESSAQ